MQEKTPVVYIMANKRNGTVYTGVTSFLLNRVFEHKNKVDKDSFTARYDCNSLVYYEIHDNMESAINKEKQIKAGTRKNKLKLIETKNPQWIDLTNTII